MKEKQPSSLPKPSKKPTSPGTSFRVVAPRAHRARDAIKAKRAARGRSMDGAEGQTSEGRPLALLPLPSGATRDAEPARSPHGTGLSLGLALGIAIGLGPIDVFKL
jgi:hypothetical protein